jgi:hypothetical protein
MTSKGLKRTCTFLARWAILAMIGETDRSASASTEVPVCPTVPIALVNVSSG